MPPADVATFASAVTNLTYAYMPRWNACSTTVLSPHVDLINNVETDDVPIRSYHMVGSRLLCSEQFRDRCNFRLTQWLGLSQARFRVFCPSPRSSCSCLHDIETLRCVDIIPRSRARVRPRRRQMNSDQAMRSLSTLFLLPTLAFASTCDAELEQEHGPRVSAQRYSGPRTGSLQSPDPEGVEVAAYGLSHKIPTTKRRTGLYRRVYELESSGPDDRCRSA